MRGVTRAGKFYVNEYRNENQVRKILSHYVLVCREFEILLTTLSLFVQDVNKRKKTTSKLL